MSIDHNTLVALAKSGGLFYFIAFSIGVLVYTFWPSNRAKFDQSKHNVLEWEDQPAGEEIAESEQAAAALEKPTWR